MPLALTQVKILTWRSCGVIRDKPTSHNFHHRVAVQEYILRTHSIVNTCYIESPFCTQHSRCRGVREEMLPVKEDVLRLQIPVADVLSVHICQPPQYLCMYMYIYMQIYIHIRKQATDDDRDIKTQDTRAHSQHTRHKSSLPTHSNRETFSFIPKRTRSRENTF